MSRLMQCSLCSAGILSDPDRRPTHFGHTVPVGFKPVFHMCHHCLQTQPAIRSQTWGWLLPRITRDAPDRSSSSRN